ncbi:hypothetical protein HZS_3015 [Henneguya salminicola]|nr:hypothetical protein HZS_3015 [Henneguya salminicola]
MKIENFCPKQIKPLKSIQSERKCLFRSSFICQETASITNLIQAIESV